MSWLDDEIKDLEREQKSNRNMSGMDFTFLMMMLGIIGIYAFNPVQASEPQLRASEYTREYWRCRECGLTNDYKDWDCWFCGESRA
jgi:rubrerythrin